MANQFGLLAKHERALRYLAAFLATLPDDYMNFGLNYFVKQEDTGFEDPIPADIARKMHTCGAVACALGHAPILGYRVWLDEHWLDVSLRLFDLHTSNDTVHAWHWCFSPDWVNTDNTPMGTAKRIIWMLQNTRDDVEAVWRDFCNKILVIKPDETRKAWVAKTYGHVIVPPLSSLDLTKLPRRASLFADRVAKGQPIIVVPA